jgi:L-threonylcarbamoyladenylate synthase
MAIKDGFLLKNMNDQITQVTKILNQGGIVIFPTDTAFGIGCRIDNEDAVKRLFKIRNRPQSQAVPALVSDLEMARKYAEEVSEDVIKKLIEPYWPGALTIVLKANKEKVSGLVRGGGETVGIRMPNHPLILEIIKKTGVAVLGPSANFHGENTPFTFEDLDPKLISLVDYVVKGECSVKQASTVVDSTQTPWKILRKGAINVNI